MTHEIVRPIPGTPGTAGDRVDASSWRNAEKLVRGRYLKPITDSATLLARIAELEAELADYRRGSKAKAAVGARR